MNDVTFGSALLSLLLLFGFAVTAEVAGPARNVDEPSVVNERRVLAPASRDFRTAPKTAQSRPR
jgi:hypothetical protein